MADQFVYSQKNNFAGGELTPTIEGRTELGLYQNGVKKLVNFMILPSGGIMRRHGTQFVHLFSENVPKKLVTVMFSRKLSYLLVFEAHAAKTTCSFFVGVELFLTTKTLKDNGRDFRFRPQDFSYCCFQGMAYISFGAGLPIFRFAVDPEVIEQFDQHLQNRLEHKKQQSSVFTSPAVAATLAASDAASFAAKDRLFIIEPLKVQLNYFKLGQGPNPNAMRAFNEVIYNAEVDKINDELKTIHQRPRENIYHQQQEQLHASCLATFENRLWCFGAGRNIHSIWASYKGDFGDFRMAYKTLLEARNPLTAFSSTFASSTFDHVLWSVPFSNELLLGTTDGIYIVKEGDRAKGEFVKIHKEIELPISPIKPVIIGKTIFFVEGNNRKINSLFYSQEKGGFQIADITPYAEHIFAEGIKEIAGINSPFSMIFAVLKNGSVASFTYSQDLKIMGWSQHWLGGDGVVLGIVPIYADNEDKLYLHVRRTDQTGFGNKEYLEVLSMGYFSAKAPEIHRPVYADCHVNINKEGEYATSQLIKQALHDDSGAEFRGDITKLEQLVRAQAENAFSLNLTGVDLGSNFKYNGKLVRDYANRASIEQFLQSYWRIYLPIILESLAASFAYLRIMGRLYATMENIFCGEIEHFSSLRQLLGEAQKLAGDIAANAGLAKGWKLPDFLGQSSEYDEHLIEYLPNSGFSFKPVICRNFQKLDLNLFGDNLKIAGQIINMSEEPVKPQAESQSEFREMLHSTASLSYKLLEYYAAKDFDHKQPLLVNLKKFFTSHEIGFYNHLLGITNPVLTRYLASSEAKNLVNSFFANVPATVPKAHLQQQIASSIKGLIGKLEQVYFEHKTDLITSSKRRQEISQLIREQLVLKNFSAANKDYLMSEEFEAAINEVMDNYELTAVGASHGAAGDTASIAGSVGGGAYSEHDEEETQAHKIDALMAEVQQQITHLRRYLISYCQQLMPSYHKGLLQEILQDEQNLKLEKYLLLSKKYFPLFKKLFPEIGAHQLHIIARNCAPSFDQIELGGVLAIFQQMLVSIIGDEELQELKILSSERLKLKAPVRYLAIGFPYSSVMQTFPFIFPEEVEHMPKLDVQFGLKIYNTKGGYIKQQDDSGGSVTQHIASDHVDIDRLVRLASEKKYLGTKYLATKEVCNILETPYISGWVEFNSLGQIKTDVDFTFMVDKPYPVSILKIYAKAKILSGYK